MTRTATAILAALIAACAVGGLVILRALGRRPRPGVPPDLASSRGGAGGSAWESYVRTTRHDGTFDPERWTHVLALVALVAALHLLICAVLVLPAWSLSQLLGVGPWALGSWMLAGVRIAALVSLVIPAVLLWRLFVLPSRMDRAWPEITRRPGVLVPAAVSLTLLAGAVALTAGWVVAPPVGSLLFSLRTGHLLSGVSPLVPLVLAGLAGVFWCLCTLARLHRVDVLAGLTLLDVNEPSWADIVGLEQRVRLSMSCPALALPGSVLWPALAMLGAAVVGLVSDTAGTIESQTMETLFVVAFAAGYGALVLAFVRGLSVWKALRALVSRVGHHPLSLVLAPLYKEFPGRVQIDPSKAPSMTAGLAVSVSGASRLVRGLDGQVDEAVAATMRAEAAAAETGLLLALEAEARGDWTACEAATRDAHAALARIVHASGPLLAPYWSPALAGPQGAAAAAGAPPPWVALAERFVAMRLADFICWTRAVLHSVTTFGTAAIVLMLMAVSSYPFQPASQLMLFNWVVVLSLVSVTVMVLVQMSRDRVLSDLSGTTPGELTFNRQFAVRLLIYGAVPILGLLGAQFPDVIGRMQPWLVSLAGVK